MKRIALGLVCISLVASHSVNAARLDVSRLTEYQEFSANFGLAFVSGLNRKGDAQTNFRAGRISQKDLELAYTFTEDATISWGTNNSYSDSQLGLHYKIIKTFPLKLEFIAHYGIAWTHDAITHDSLGNNNIDAGLRIHGIAWRNLQWAMKVLGQYVWAEPKNFWDIKTTSELMLYFYDNLASRTTLEIDISQIDAPRTLLYSSLQEGIIYNINDKVSVNPYVLYRFKTHNGSMGLRNPHNYWQLGLDFSVQF